MQKRFENSEAEEATLWAETWIEQLDNTNNAAHYTLVIVKDKEGYLISYYEEKDES